MNQISFMTANFVARQVNYHMTGWGEAQDATMAYFRPLDTYAERFAAVLDEVCAMGFTAIDLWLPHLHPDWATDAHIVAARDALAKRGLQVASLAGGFGETPAEFERSCRLAEAVGTRVLGGMTSLLFTRRSEVLRLLEKYDAILAIENHPEKTPAEVLAEIGDTGSGRILTCVDTGIWAMHGYDPVKAIEELGPYIVHVHLKDVEQHFDGQFESCRYGRGVVPLQNCVARLRKIGYTGGYSVEHEPHDYNPCEDARVSAEMLRGWLA